MLPRAERNSEAYALDLTYMDLLDRGTKIDLPGLIIRHIKRIVDTDQKAHSLVCSYILHQVFEHFRVSLGVGKWPTAYQKFGKNMLNNCDFYLERIASKIPMPLKPEQPDDSEDDVGPEDVMAAVGKLEQQMQGFESEVVELKRQLQLKDQEIDRLKIECNRHEAKLVVERAKNTKNLDALIKHFNLKP